MERKYRGWREKIHVQETVCSNPNTGNWMDLFHINLLYLSVLFVRRDTNKRKRGQRRPRSDYLPIIDIAAAGVLVRWLFELVCAYLSRNVALTAFIR